MWSPVLSIIIGLFLMAAPGIFDYGAPAADNDHIVGPIVITLSVIALSGCTRNVQRANLVSGFWLLLAPFILGYDSSIYFIDLICGAMLFVCGFFTRKKTEDYGGGWTYLFR